MHAASHCHHMQTVAKSKVKRQTPSTEASTEHPCNITNAPHLNSLRCSTPKSARRSGSSRYERLRLPNMRQWPAAGGAQAARSEAVDTKGAGWEERHRSRCQTLAAGQAHGGARTRQLQAYSRRQAGFWISKERAAPGQFMGLRPNSAFSTEKANMFSLQQGASVGRPVADHGMSRTHCLLRPQSTAQSSGLYSSCGGPGACAYR